MRWRNALALGILAAVGGAAMLTVPPGGGGAAPQAPSRLSRAAAWSGLVGGPRTPVATGQRVLVVLSAFSLADRVEREGGLASDRDERGWSAAAYAAQQQFIASLGRMGVPIKPEFRFTRTLNGFSALLDPRAIALVERTPGVKGVYPVRVAFPASVSSRVLGTTAFAPGFGRRPDVRLAGSTGRGVTIALLDTGVDLRKPYLHGHVLDGFDILGGGPDAHAVAKPRDPTQLERHGTEMAGLLVGARGTAGLAGVAPAATVLPIRVAGWQPDDRGGYTVSTRTDQLLAGLERAVDPNGDGDAHDAARIALIPLVEPFAAFSDSPLARAAAGALRLDTLVVTAAGNDGPAGPAFGSIGGPAGAPAALSVGAVDARRVTQQVRVVVRAGLSVLLDRVVPLVGAVTPERTLLLSPAAPHGSATALEDFFEGGESLVAGRLAVVPAGADPAAAARWAAEAGADAVVLRGRAVAPGAIGLDERTGVPVLSLPESTARLLLERPDALVAIAARRTGPAAADTIAAFSSWGLAFDGGLKPELLAPGVGLVTAEPGTTPDGRSAFGTVNGSSAAAAVVAGAAALLAEARPEADAETLRALLIGGSDAVARLPLPAQGTGLLDLGRSAASELVADPPAIAFGRGTGDGWQGRRVLRLRNVSRRRLTLFVATGQTRSARVRLIVSPTRVEIEPGGIAEVTVRTRPITIARGDAASGVLTLTPVAGAAVRVPWAVVLRAPRGLLGPLTLSRRSFEPSESRPAVVVVRAGRVLRSSRGNEVVPLLRLDVELWTADGKRLGLLARLRDLLPGRYAFGLTGRGPGGVRLEPGRYRLRVYAWPTAGGPPGLRSLSFSIR
ncbi:MAG TPA: S8 family serine peptidase [Gaiellaceae bacterium]